MPFFSWWYRRRLWAFRYLQIRDLLPVAASIIAIGLAVNSYSTKPTLSVVLGVLYIVALGTHFVLGLHARQALDRGQGEVLAALFCFINDQAFNSDYRTRFTLFVPAPWKHDYIIPWYRYRAGGMDPITEARSSKARYKRGEGETGHAWAEAGRKVRVRSFPEFRTRQEFKMHYIDVLNVGADVVEDLSPYMERVQTIFSYGFVGHNNRRTLGVLSLDLQAPVTKTPSGYSFPSPEEDGQIELDWSRLELLSSRFKTCLRLLSQANDPRFSSNATGGSMAGTATAKRRTLYEEAPDEFSIPNRAGDPKAGVKVFRRDKSDRGVVYSTDLTRDDLRRAPSWTTKK